MNPPVHVHNRPAAWPSDWLIPDWPAPPCVRAVCTTRTRTRSRTRTRTGGVSRSPYDSLNLGDHVGDDPRDVAANRLFFEQALGVTPVFLKQVHAQDVLHVRSASQGGQVTDVCDVADAAWSDQSGVACTVLVADCLPLLLTTRSGGWVAAVHVGWRGLDGLDGSDQCDGKGILEQVCQVIKSKMPVNQAQFATDAIAWMGPCIGPTAFEVGPDVHAALTRHHPQAAEMFCPVATVNTVKWRADLAGLVRQRLLSLGISQIFGNDSTAPWCTVSQPERFFSHRRDGVSGRLAASIWLQSSTF